MSHVPNYSGGAPVPEPPAYRDAAYRATSGSLDIGATLSESFAIFGRRGIPLIGLMVVLFIPLIIIGIGFGFLVASGGSQIGVWITAGISAVLGIIATLLGQTAATVAVVDDLRRQPFSLPNALAVTLRRLMPILGVTLLASLAIIVGTLLLVIPGLILMVMFYVAIPACAVERTGPGDSLSRSGFLTKGQRWRIFALILIVGIVTGVIGSVIEYIGTLFGTIPGSIVKVLWQAVTSAFGAILTGVVYYRLRMLKEGVDIAAISNVFD